MIYTDHFQKHIKKGSRVGIWKQDIITTISLFFAILECDCTAVIFSDRDPVEKIDRQSQYILLDHMIEDPLFIDPNDKISIVDHLGEDQMIKGRRSSSSHLDLQKIPKQYCTH